MILLALQVIFIGPDAIPWRGDPLPRPPVSAPAQHPSAAADPGPLKRGSGSAIYHLPRLLRPIALIAHDHRQWLAQRRNTLLRLDAVVYCIDCNIRQLAELQRIWPQSAAANGEMFAHQGVSEYPALLLPGQQQ